MTTAYDIVTSALRKSGVTGVGQTPQAEDAADALADLNDLLAQWARERWLVYHLVDVANVSDGSASYAVGPGLAFNTDRPDRLEAAYVRNISTSAPYQPDYPLKLLESREDYNRIALKGQGTFPQIAYYDAAFPAGQVYFWPVPFAGRYELHLTLKQPLSAFATLSQVVSLPPEYLPALKWNLAARVRASYALPADPETSKIARGSLAVIRGANAQIPRLRMPAALKGAGGYDVYSDR